MDLSFPEVNQISFYGTPSHSTFPKPAHFYFCNNAKQNNQSYLKQCSRKKWNDVEKIRTKEGNESED